MSVDLPELELARPSPSTVVRSDAAGVRWYRAAHLAESTPHQYPSVTSILAATMPADRKAKLEAWRANDPAAAERIMVHARDRGTVMHRMCEAKLFGRPADVAGFPEEVVIHAARCFESLAEVLAGIRWFSAVELPFLEPENRYAGTIDLVASFEEGTLDVVDWKTAEGWKDPDWVHDYRLQVAAYAAAWNLEEAKQPERIAVYSVSDWPPARPGSTSVIPGRAPYVKRARIVIANLYREAQVIVMGRDELLARWVEFRARLATFWALQAPAA